MLHLDAPQCACWEAAELEPTLAPARSRAFGACRPAGRPTRQLQPARSQSRHRSGQLQAGYPAGRSTCLQDAQRKELDLRAPVNKQRAKKFDLQEELAVSWRRPALYAPLGRPDHQAPRP